MEDLLSNFANPTILPSSFPVDDLLNNLADQSIESPTEEGYKYHFVNGSPAGSELAMPVSPALAGSSHNESSSNLKETNDAAEDEANYNADIDDDDDDDDEYGREEAAHELEYADPHKDPTNGASYNEKSQSENPIDTLHRSFHNGDYEGFQTHGVNASSDDAQDALNGFTQHLRRLHRQDVERDELLTQLHLEILDLKRALKKSVPGGNARAEAAERSLFEIRKTLDKNLYVCVLIDGNGYKIHEDLLQSGKRGGIEAADRLSTEVSNYLQQFRDNWEIMVHFHIDIAGLLASCVNADIPLSDNNVRDFMIGFTQAQPLFTIVDVGYDPENLSRKIEGMFHLFVNNVQCKHLIFGCCHNSAYAIVLEPYASNPITASSITLLKSYESNTYFESLPFDSVEFPHVFRSTPFKATDRLAENPGNEVGGGDEALAKWQAAANASIPLRTRAHPYPQAKHSGWATERNVLLNINNERVDHELGEVDYEISESMLDRMEEQRFCVFYHLQDSCVAKSQRPCKFRHGPRLNNQELHFLKKDCRRMPCNFGSRCRKPDCIYGHVCKNQPGCEKGPNCRFHRFHEVDKTAVRVWSTEGSLSPRKRR